MNIPHEITALKERIAQLEQSNADLRQTIAAKAETDKIIYRRLLRIEADRLGE